MAVYVKYCKDYHSDNKDYYIISGNRYIGMYNNLKRCPNMETIIISKDDVISVYTLGSNESIDIHRITNAKFKKNINIIQNMSMLDGE